LYDEYCNNIDLRKYTCSIFVDLKKAFDTVNHEILIEKLQKYGIRGLPLQIVKIYLSHRTQYNIINNIKSNTCSLICSVPQGSTLGPLLFLIYINDLPLASDLSIKLFADDEVLLMSDICIEKLTSDINDELKKIDYWMGINKLFINYTKTKCMFICNKKYNEDYKIKIRNHELEQVKK